MRNIKLIVAAIAVVLSGTFAALSPQAANALSSTCVWKYASWGKGCVYYTTRQLGKTQDILTDGYCVYAAHYNSSTGHYEAISGSRSCGGIASFEANINGDSYRYVRLYRDNGSYLQLK